MSKKRRGKLTKAEMEYAQSLYPKRLAYIKRLMASVHGTASELAAMTDDDLVAYVKAQTEMQLKERARLSGCPLTEH